MKLQKKNFFVFVTAVTATFIITIGSISLAADKTDTPKNMIDSETAVEALADGCAVREVSAFASGQTLSALSAPVVNNTTAAVRQAKTDYETKLETERIAAEEAARIAAEEAERIAAEEAERIAAEETFESSLVTDASSSDLELLAALIFCEAGNQPYEGQVAVGAVVMNRVRSVVYPNSISEVIYQSGQFTPAMTGWLDNILTSSGYTDAAMQAAADAIAGNNPIGDLLYFDCGGFGYQIGDHFFH